MLQLPFMQNYYLHFMELDSKLNKSDAFHSIDLKSYKTNGTKVTIKAQEHINDVIDETKKNNLDLYGLKLYLYVLSKIWLLLLNIIIIYLITFSLFPSLQANISPVNHVIPDNYFVPVFCFLLFPLCKTFGNYLAELLPKPSVNSLIIYSLLRIVFIPFFVFCNFNAQDRNIPVLFHNDYIYILGASLMALTSGHLSSICLMYCPKSVEQKYASIAGMMASFTILFGILLGLTFSLLYPIIVKMN